LRSVGATIRGASKELGVSQQTLRNSLGLADLDDGRLHDGLTNSEQEAGDEVVGSCRDLQRRSPPEQAATTGAFLLAAVTAQPLEALYPQW